MGSPGRIIETDEGTSKIFLIPGPDRTSSTFLDIIKTWVLDCTTITSDFWKFYDCLQDERFIYLTVNHSQHFVDPETGAHTQNIKRTWREVKSKIPRYSTSKAHYEGYLAENVPVLKKIWHSGQNFKILRNL
ncbi:hypothetical protein NQ317_000763 [Molorchus minor]|uniref:ISXO2-like transposase domain-containing protein n=1 Tax=Molorchus minor TaxID=1323400 RepID=A0ABQ9IYC9_9CUCU|nr:hypothetical protein NQ317_000763 [Molorchus minor]